MSWKTSKRRKIGEKQPWKPIWDSSAINFVTRAVHDSYQPDTLGESLNFTRKKHLASEKNREKFTLLNLSFGQQRTYLSWTTKAYEGKYLSWLSKAQQPNSGNTNKSTRMSNPYFVKTFYATSLFAYTLSYLWPAISSWWVQKYAPNRTLAFSAVCLLAWELKTSIQTRG